ncbi:hypothetical protein ACHWQZ_G001821 [Mnemiopsis leidyi]
MAVKNGETNGLSERAYTFIIQTGADIPTKHSTSKWSDGTMILTINPGSKTAESKPLKVHKNFPSMTEGAVTVDFWLPPNIGVPKLIKVDLESNKFELIKDALYVREITILYNRDPYRFPIKNFVYPHNPIRGNPTVAEMGCPPHFLVREGAGTLKHHETEDFIIKAREEDLEIIHSMVQWNDIEENPTDLLFPGFVGILEYDKLPRFLQFREAKLDAFNELRSAGLKEIRANVLDNLMNKILLRYKEERFESFEHYEMFLKLKSDEMGWSKEMIEETLKVAKIFRQDEEFGRQMLCGPNAMYIKKVTALDARWSGGTVPEHSLEGKSLSEVIAEGHLFEVNFDELIGVGHGGSLSKKLTGTKQIWYVVLADCLLYVRNDGKLVPVQIRLENRNDGEAPTWWGPPSPDISDLNRPVHLGWLYAKMWFRSADVNVYSLCTHFARAHAVNEVFAMACYRNLPNAHPIFRMLQPHIQGIIPVNVQARGVLINPGRNAISLFLSAGDNLSHLFNNYYKKFNYEDLILPLDVEKRGVGDIPEYLYRDDTLSHWNIISKYVSEMVHLSYLSDEDVVLDTEMQNAVKDAVDMGYRGFEDGAGFPRAISTREKLTEYLTAMVVNISVFHTAVNFQTFTSYAYPPNVPTCMAIPPPSQETEITMKLILECLPVMEITFIAMNVSYNLGQFSPVERFYLGHPAENRLGMLGENMAVSPEQEACIRRMEDRMRVFQAEVDTRNEGRYLKYDVLSPRNTPLTTQT